MNRRTFLTGLGLAAAGPRVLQGFSARQTGVLPIYASAGPELTQYDLDVARGTLTTRTSVTVPANMQEAWPHPTLRLLYAAWSDGASGTRHGVSVFRVDAKTGVLTLAALPTVLARRPIYLTLDHIGRYLLIAYNLPSGISVHPLADDGSVGAAIRQADGLDFGTYAHQIRIAPSNRFVILVTRGNEPTATSAEDPGALKPFRFADGHLSPLASIAIDNGRAFRSRHVDFHPSGRWMYLTLESQNRLLTFGVSDDGISSAPLFDTTTLATPAAVPEQTTSTVHVHPTGRFVYVGNRSTGVTTRNGMPAVAGGDNSIAAFAIDARTGEPTRIHNVDTAGIQPRTFMLDPSGRALVVANQTVLNDAAGRTLIPANLSTFHIGNDGRLTFVRKYDVDTTTQRSLFWVGSLGR